MLIRSSQLSIDNESKVVYHLHWSVGRSVGRSVDGLGKWYAKFRTGKFRAGIVFAICTNPFHLLRNDREGLKLVPKKALKKWNTNFCLEYSIRKNRLPFQMFRCSLKFSAEMTQEVVFHLLFNRVLRKRFDIVNNR